MAKFTEGWEAKLAALKELGARHGGGSHRVRVFLVGKRRGGMWTYRGALRRNTPMPGGRVLKVVERDGLTMVTVVRWGGSEIKGGKGGAL